MNIDSAVTVELAGGVTRINNLPEYAASPLSRELLQDKARRVEQPKLFVMLAFGATNNRWFYAYCVSGG